MSLIGDQASIVLQTASGEPRPFRVGLVLDGPRAAGWVECLLENLRRLPSVETRVLQTSNGRKAEGGRPGWLMDRLYARCLQTFDPFSEVAVNVDPLTIQSAGCDLLIWLAKNRDADRTPAELARFGALTIRLGEGNEAFPFWEEVSRERRASAVFVYQHESSFERARPVCQAETATLQGWNFTENAWQPLTAAVRLLCSICVDLQHGRALPSTPEEVLPPRPVVPSNLDVLRFGIRKTKRSLSLRRRAKGRKARWFIASRPNRGSSIVHPASTDLSGFTEIVPPPGTGQIADPFVWQKDGRTYLLFEEILDGGRGRLCALELTPNGAAGDITVVLDRAFHLSYPCVFPWSGELFLLPEAYCSGRLDLYRFSSFPSNLELISTVLPFGVVDSTPLFLDDRWYLFTTTAEPYMETRLYVSNQLDGRWTLHPSSPISRSVKNSRSAGHIFRKDGRLFRPTQDCSVRYGYGMTVNEITRLTPTEFEEHQVHWIGPAWRPDLLATHTWNESEQFQVIDGYCYK